MLSYQAHSSYPEGSLQHPPSGQGYGSHSPYMGTVSFPEPQHSSTSPLQSYFPPSQTTPNLAVPTHHQHERRGSHSHFPGTGSSSDSHGSRSPYAGTVPFPDPQRSSSISTPQSYFPSSQTTPNLPVAPHHQHGRQSSQGHFPGTGSSSDSQTLYAAGASSDTGGGSNFYSQPGVQPHPGGGHTASGQPQDWGAAKYEEPDVRTKAPRGPPVGTNSKRCA
jgi:hypothetical protein